MKTTTNASINRNERHAGIDIGKSTLDLCIYEVDIYRQFSNNSEGIKALAKILAHKHLLNECRVQKLNRQQKAPAALARSHIRFIKVLDKKIKWVNGVRAKAVAEVS